MIKIFKEISTTIHETNSLREAGNFRLFTIKIVIKNNPGKKKKATVNKIYLR